MLAAQTVEDGPTGMTFDDKPVVKYDIFSPSFLFHALMFLPNDLVEDNIYTKCSHCLSRHRVSIYEIARVEKERCIP